ncbi:MAG: amino acid racemase [Oscillospiraceae bacterium]|nr:amino acid racemase [Oscillospiraceae bacterium]
MKLGLIGGTGPESTVVYYREIVYGVQQRAGRAFFPNLTVESLSVFDVLQFCELQDYDGLVQYLLGGVRSLAGAGAQCAALTGITPHIVFDELSALSPIPLVSMVETSCVRAEKQGLKKVGLLGTLPTMNAGFFQRAFASQGIEAVTPTESEKEYIGSKIETEIEYGKVIPSTQNEFCAIAERMEREEKIEALVLGCTELPLIFEGVRLPVPYLDVMRIHIDALIDAAMRG